jgi:hypothetical protein
MRGRLKWFWLNIFLDGGEKIFWRLIGLRSIDRE